MSQLLPCSCHGEKAFLQGRGSDFVSGLLAARGAGGGDRDRLFSADSCLWVPSSPSRCLPRLPSWAAAPPFPQLGGARESSRLRFRAASAPFRGSHGLSADQAPLLQGASGECGGGQAAYPKAVG